MMRRFGVREASPSLWLSVRLAMGRWVWVALLVALVSSVAMSAEAEPSAADRAAAEALFDQAIALIEEGDYATACPKLQESQRLDPGVGTLLYLADCYQQTGRTASAWATFKEAAYAAKNAGQADREAVANEHAEALKAELSYLVVRVDEPADEQQIRLDGNVMSAALLASPIPVDPGEHRVEASAPGKVLWEELVAVPKGASETTLTIPPLEDQQPEPVAAPAPAPAPASPPASTAPPAPAATPDDVGADKPVRRGRRTAGYVIGGVGIIGLSLSAVLAANAKSKDREADDECLPDDPLQCSPRGVELSKEARDAASGATITAVLGGAALATGVALVFTSKKSRRAKRSALARIEVAPLVVSSGGGALLTGGF